MKAPHREVRFSPTVVLVLVVLALAAGALLSRRVDAPVPGTLRLGVLAEESSIRAERALGPLAAWLGEPLRSAGVVVAPGTAGIAELSARCDVMLVPAAVAQESSPALLLAWVRPVGGAPLGEGFTRVEAPGLEGPCAVPTRGLAGQFPPGGCDSLFVAGSPFADRGLLRAFVAGSYRSVIVRASILDDARQAGWFPGASMRPALHRVPGQWLALVASPHLEQEWRREVRAAALNLDKYRLEPSHRRSASVLHALSEFGIGGFAPAGSVAAERP